MSLWKLAKSIAHDKSIDVKEVYDRLVKNRKKVRRMEGRVRTFYSKKTKILNNTIKNIDKEV